jgi:uncharacterized membrane protein YdjX (TVP38/TMEM64 family)
VSVLRFARRFGLILLIVALAVAFVATGAWRLMSFEQLQRHHAALEHFVRQHRVLAPAVYLGVFIVVVAACVPGPGLMCTVSGYLFGTVFGGLVNLTACVAGSAVVFLACRSAFAGVIARRGGARVRDVEQALRRNAFSYLLTLKLMPILPFAVPNIAAGLAGVRLSAVIWASALGSAPVCFILASLGAGLGRFLDRDVTPSLHLFERPDVYGPLLALSLLSIAGLAWRLIRRRRSLPAPPR